ncbi:MAG: nuclear transport factor 2 family protein [Clostridia bacterium]|nr:nuclear transport factor 2 family protein [Clostridia bacterium]NCC44597.1 nuclear transport factor 2 family protein [Clostridia bacterium]
MNDQKLIEECYKIMYQGMIDKDRDTLNSVLDNSFVLIHMTGMHQPKQEFIRAVENGTLNYYSAGHQSITVDVHGDRASLDGRSMVNAAVFGGGPHTWRLRQRIELVKKDDTWFMTESVASTY